MRLTRILIADDHPLMLDGTRDALKRCEDFEIVGEAHSGSEVLPVIGGPIRDLVLLDMRMPGMDGLTCLERIRKQRPQIKVVILSAFNEPEQISAALKRGAFRLHRQERQPARPASSAAPDPRGHRLPRTRNHRRRPTGPRHRAHRPRACHPQRPSLCGLSNQAIGKELWVTEQTVKFHLTNIYRKLGVANRTEAARYAYQHALVDRPALELADRTHSPKNSDRCSRDRL